MDATFCHRLPKLELHAHLNGSITLDTLKELYSMKQKNKEQEGLRRWDSAEYLKESYSLTSFFSLFKRTHTLTSNPEAVEVATERVIEDFAKENVIYLELRSTLRKESNMTKKEYLEAMIAGIANARKKYPNTAVKLLVSVNRSQNFENAEENVNLAIEYHAKYPDLIVGMDVSGNPITNKFLDYVKILDRARSKGLKMSIHCGEIKGKEEIRQILQFHPDRIGHATCIHKSRGGDSRLWQTLLDKKIPVEICLTSNIKCHIIHRLEDHHFKFLYDEKHPVTICTDDKGAFDTNLTREFEILQTTFGLSEEELWKLSYNSIDYIFSDDKEKESLRTKAKQKPASPRKSDKLPLPCKQNPKTAKWIPKNFSSRATSTSGSGDSVLIEYPIVYPNASLKN